MEKRKTICFAYFADDKFIGWYSDTFGSITPMSPKLYPDSQEMIDRIFSNFASKMKKINETSFDEAKEKVKGLQALSLAVFSGEELLKGSNATLRVVECPIYDGPNPDFDKEAYDALLDERKAKMQEAGIFDIPAPSSARSKAIDEFNEKNPRPACDNWIYADYSKVKEWASQEPTEFLNLSVYQS
jgi:hypothetical protein